MDAVLVANSPGELSVLVKPVAAKLKEKGARVILILTPCQYASGNEIEFSGKNLAVDEIVSADNYKKWILGGKTPASFGECGVCLYLGGDLLHATMIAKKLNYPAYAYLSGKFISWISSYKKFFVPDNKMLDYFIEKSVPAEKLQTVGDLMVDGTSAESRIDARTRWHIGQDAPVIAFMPGSRKWEIDHMLPLYEKIVKVLKKDKPELITLLIASPFVSIEYFLKYQEHHIFEAFVPFESVSAADLVVTIPGTNTAQIAALGLPMQVLFPLDRPEVIPLEGILHYISGIPILRYGLKRLIAWQINRKTKYFALPNIKAGRFVVEEMRGTIDPKAAAKMIFGLINDRGRLEKTSRELKAAMGDPGAAGNIVEEILK